MEKDFRWVVVGTIISWSIGFLGADRIYKGEIGVGLLKMFTFGGFGIWWLVDALSWTYKLGQVK